MSGRTAPRGSLGCSLGSGLFPLIHGVSWRLLGSDFADFCLRTTSHLLQPIEASIIGDFSEMGFVISPYVAYCLSISDPIDLELCARLLPTLLHAELS